VLAWLFLGEAPGLAGLAGIALVSAGVFLTQDLRRKGAVPAETTDLPESADVGED
jgi:hypothetical protein